MFDMWTFCGSWIGCLLLGRLFPGFFGSLVGLVVGAYVATWLKKNLGIRTTNGGRRPNASGFRYSGASAQQRARIFCASAAAMLAKLAKADGHVTTNEIAAVEAAFSRLGFDAAARAYAVSVFRKAKDDSHTIYEYAAEFAAAVDSIEVRELFYGLLWDLACADGRLGSSELAILRHIPFSLGIRLGWFDYYYRERTNASSSYGGRSRMQEPPRDALADAYATLGVSPSASDAQVRKAYRELAKKNHPDLLRAQGLPEELIGKATEKMGRINEAWSVVKERRGI